MSNRKQLEKWGAIVLGVLCVFLVFRLVSEIMGSPAPDVDADQTLSQPAPRQVNSETREGKAVAARAEGDPAYQMQALQEFKSSPLPDVNRDPFNFGAPPVSPAQKAAEAARAAAAANAPPPPPRMPFRAIGYSVKAGVGPQAFLADSDQVYVVHDGELISGRYRIIKITTSMVEVQDASSGETAQLPIPQVQ